MISLVLALLVRQDLSAQIDEAVAKSVKPDGPGMAVLVMQHGKVLHKKGYGLANLEHRVAVTTETVFDLASVSKQFTATAVMILADRGKLAFEDDVRKVLPELPEHDKARPIRIEDLLHHTSGLPDYLGLLDKMKGDPDRLKNGDVLKLVAAEKLQFPTGTKWAYSNSNYCLLALVVERLEKKTFGAFAREAIFEPLGMKGTVVFEDVSLVIPNRASGYERRRAGPRAAHSDLTNTGDGAVFTSADDWVKWELELRKPTLVKPETLGRAWTAGKLDGGKEHHYGFGWMVVRRDGKLVVDHAGGWVGFLTYCVRHVDDGLTVAVFSNSAPGPDPSAVARAIVKLVPTKERKDY